MEAISRRLFCLGAGAATGSLLSLRGLSAAVQAASSPYQRPKLKITPLEDRIVVTPDDEGETMRGPVHCDAFMADVPYRYNDTIKRKKSPGRCFVLISLSTHLFIFRDLGTPAAPVLVAVTIEK